MSLPYVDPWEYAKKGDRNSLFAFLTACKKNGTLDINMLHPLTGETLLYTTVAHTPLPMSNKLASEKGYVFTIRLLCENFGADIGAGCSGTGRTPIHLAAERKSVEITKYLVVSQKGPLKPDAGGIDPYTLAVQCGSLECAKIIEDESLQRALTESSLNSTQPHNVLKGLMGSPRSIDVIPPKTDGAFLGGGHLQASESTHIYQSPPTQVNTQRPVRPMSAQEQHPPQTSISRFIQDITIADSDEDSSGSPNVAVATPPKYAHGSKNSTLSDPVAPATPPSNNFDNKRIAVSGRNTNGDSSLPSPSPLREAPQLILNEVFEFKKKYSESFDFVYMIQNTDAQTGALHVLSIRGLIPYCVQGSTYFGPIIVLGFYPSALCEQSTSSSLLHPTEQSDCGANRGRSSVNSTKTSPFFKAFVDVNNMNGFLLNKRATSYFDPFTGAFLPSPSDYLFKRLSLFVEFVVVRNFEAIAPLVVSKSASAFKGCVPLGPSFDQNQNSVACSGAVSVLPGLRMLYDASTSLPVHLPTNSKSSIRDILLYPHASNHFFFCPITGKPLLPPTSASSNQQNITTGLSPPPLSLLFPFTVDRHPICMPQIPCVNGEKQAPYFPNSAEQQRIQQSVQKSWGLLRLYQIYEDISSFADGLLTYIPETQAVIGLLPVMGSRPQTLLVRDIDDLREFITSTLHLGEVGYNPRGSLGSPLASPVSSRTGTRTNAYRIGVQNMERLWDVRVKIEFKGNVLDERIATRPLTGECEKECGFDYPPRVFFPDAATGAPGSAATTLTQRCFAPVLLHAETGELNPIFLCISAHGGDGAVGEGGGEVNDPRSSTIGVGGDAVLNRDANGRVVSPLPGAYARVTGSPISAGPCLLDSAVWRQRARPLRDLLYELKYLSVDLLGQLAIQTGDEKLLRGQQGTEFSSVKENNKMPIANLDELFSNDSSVPKTSGSLLPTAGVEGYTAPGGSSSQEKCILCLVGSKDVVFRPCNHLVSCRKCAAQRCLHESSSCVPPQLRKEFYTPEVETDSTMTASGFHLSSWKCPACGIPITGLSEVYV